MPSMSERATRAHRARRLGGSAVIQQRERRSAAVSESPSRVPPSPSNVPTTRRSSSIPPPVTPEFEPATVRKTSSFLEPDMVDDDVPMDEMQDIRKARGTAISPVKDIHKAPVAPVAAVTPPRITHAASYEDARLAYRKRHTPPRLAQPSLSEEEKSNENKEERSLPRQSPTLGSYFAADAKMDAADRGGGHLVPSDDVSSVGSSATSLVRLASAIRRRATKRPDNLTIEEKAVWDVVQSAVEKQRSEMLAKRRILERRLQESTSQVDKLRVHNLELQRDLDTATTNLHNATTNLQSKKRQLHTLHKRDDAAKGTEKEDTKQLEDEVADLQRKYNDAVQLAENQQEEHDRAIRAIQRVLADVNEAKEEELKELQDRIQELQDDMEKRMERGKQVKPVETSEIASLRARAQRTFQLEGEMDTLKTAIAHVEEERDGLQSSLDQKAGALFVLDRELNSTQTALQNAKEKESGLLEVISRQRKLLDEPATTQLDDLDGANETETVAAVKKVLVEKTKSLDNAKKLITSLEVANGSMAKDLRAKLKDKEEQVTILRSDAETRKKMMDSLATELRNVQTDKIESDKSGVQIQESQQVLAAKLEKAIDDLQSASVVLESSGASDDDTMDEISVILCNSLMALKTTLAELEEPEGNSDSITRSKVASNNEDAIRKVERQKMNQKMKILDATLKKTEGEVALMKIQNDRLQLEKNQQEAKLQEEIKYLRTECRTNMEVLSKKEQELCVLRDSLEVSDDVGYISGESDEEDDGNQSRDIKATLSHDTGASNYSASKAEALATLLIHSGSGIEVTGNVSANGMEHLHKELKKAQRETEKANRQLGQERESLANAKMIISSLEKANKTMLEDLRSRLQDSNTAIAALLDKSLVNEKNCKELQDEIDSMTKERKKIKGEHEAELTKLRDEALVSGLRLAAKDREISSLMGKENDNTDHNSTNDDK